MSNAASPNSGAPRPLLSATTPSACLAQRWFVASFGIWLALCLSKLGNPVVLGHLVVAPQTLPEFLQGAWPIQWGSWLALPVFILAACALRPVGLRFSYPTAAGLLWFAWQWLAAVGSVDPPLSKQVLLHFSICAGCFAAGYLGLSAVDDLRWFWAPLVLAFAWNLWVGLNQHFGGLDAVRDWVYAQPDWRNLPPEYLTRIGSNRIFAGFVYPNAFAGSLLLLLPALSLWLWEATRKLPRMAHGVICGLFAYSGLACLYWTGSKAAWLIALFVGAFTVWAASGRGKLRFFVAAGILSAGLLVFAFRFADYFRRGAPSVGARSDYWAVALGVASEQPLFGAGPGSFYELYRERKLPQSEMTRLVHNDYLQQACDSGWVASAAYLVFIFGCLIQLYRERQPNILNSSLLIGCTAWALHGFAEFGLYIPGLAWPFFAFLGFLLGRSQRFGSTSQRPAG